MLPIMDSETQVMTFRAADVADQPCKTTFSWFVWGGIFHCAHTVSEVPLHRFLIIF